MFAKVYSQIFDSSIAEDYRVRLVFEDFLKLAGKDGIVDMTRESIARRTNVPLDIVTHGIAELEKPDKASRTKAMDGRRIVRLDDHRDWGWRIVNHEKYRESATKEMLRMADADRKKAYRAKFKKVSPTPPPKNSVQSTDTEAERSHDMSRTCPGQSRTVNDTNSNRTFRLKAMIGEIYHRKPDDNWPYHEECLLAEVARRKEAIVEFEEIKRYRARNGKYFPQSAHKLLEGWVSIIDRARSTTSKRREVTL